MLKVFARLDPVPAVSIKHECRALTRTARDRSPLAIPVNSSTVSPFAASATSAAAICASVASASSNDSSNCSASSRFSLRDERDAQEIQLIDGLTCAVNQSLQKIGEQLFTFGSQNRFGMKLHAFDLQFAMTQSHDDVVRPCAPKFPDDCRQRLFLDNQRVIASRLKTIRSVPQISSCPS